MKFFLASLMLLSTVAVQGVTLQSPSLRVPAPPAQTQSLTGRWRVKFAFSGGGEKNLIFDSKAKGYGLFLLLDTGPNDKPVPDPLPAVWSQLTNDRVSFSGEAELPIGTCCREIGTLIFKGKFESNNSVSGKLIFVTGIDDDESPYRLRSIVGTFTAARVQ